MNGQRDCESPEPGIAIVNQSTLVDDETVERIAQACAYQIHEHVEPLHGLRAVDVWFSPAREELPKGTQVVCVFDDDQQVAEWRYYTNKPGNDPKVVGIRVIRDDGLSYARVFVRPYLDNGNVKAYGGAESLAVSISHEVAEARADRLLNRYVMGPGGALFPLEICDPVEDVSYEIALADGKVSVADFVLPAWADPQETEGPFDYCQMLKAPFTCTDGGYIMALRPPAREEDPRLQLLPTNEFEARRPPYKRSPLSRTSWRNSGPQGVIWSQADGVIW
jgi:hypothetical protein